MYLPLQHNGQTFDLAPVDAYASGRFNVLVEREVTLNAWQDADGDWNFDEVTISQSLGTIFVQDWGVEVSTRYNGDRTGFDTITEAVAFLVDEGRPCTHPDGDGIDDDRFECVHCGATYALTDDGTVVDVRFASKVA